MQAKFVTVWRRVFFLSTTASLLTLSDALRCWETVTLTVGMFQLKYASSCPLEAALRIQTGCRKQGHKCNCDYECCNSFTCEDSVCSEKQKHPAHPEYHLRYPNYSYASSSRVLQTSHPGRHRRSILN